MRLLYWQPRVSLHEDLVPCAILHVRKWKYKELQQLSHVSDSS